MSATDPLPISKIRFKAISRRWSDASNGRGLIHDDGSTATPTDKGWMLQIGAKLHGPFEYFDDARYFHANQKVSPWTLEVTQLHHEAMELADAADAALRQGLVERATALNRQAFEKEREAANSLADRPDLEPTRSILHRSAASLALLCNEIREAERLITFALSEDPPAEIAEELRDLLKNVYFHRHLN